MLLLSLVGLVHSRRASATEPAFVEHREPANRRRQLILAGRTIRHARIANLAI